MLSVKWKSLVFWSGILLVLFLLFSSFVELSFQFSFSSSNVTTDWRKLRTSTVAIVPGAAVSGKSPSTILRDRLECGLLLYKKGRAKKILLSGDNGKSDYNELKPMLDFMLKGGVREEDVFADHAGFRTLDTLLRAKSVFKVKEAIFVSQSVFLSRAVYLGKSAGLDLQAFQCDTRHYQKALYYEFREIFARHLAWWDIHVWDTSPKYLGDPFPIDSSGESTWRGSIVPEKGQ